MLKNLIIKGRRYYSSQYKEYVFAVKTDAKSATFLRSNGSVIKSNYKDISYLSPADYNMCIKLAVAAKITWYCPFFDNGTGTEYNCEGSRLTKKYSFRNAIRDLSEGLVDDDFQTMTYTEDYYCRFRAMLHGMGLKECV